jgi:hypothetical protein
MPNQDDLSLLEMPVSQLDLMIGDALVAEEFGAKDLTDAEKQATARRWFDSRLEDFRHAICVASPLRTRIFAPEKLDRNTLFAAVIDALSKILGMPVPVAVVSARLIHYGLDKLRAPPSQTG